jgi:hypothetical protein
MITLEIISYFQEDGTTQHYLGIHEDEAFEVVKIEAWKANDLINAFSLPTRIIYEKNLPPTAHSKQL